MTDTAADTRPADAGEDRDLAFALAKAIWRSRSDRNVSAEDRRAAWREGQAGFRQEARKLLRSLEASGLVLSRDPEAAPDADD